MNIERDCIPDIARSAVELVLRGEYDKARSAIGSIDYKGLIAQRQIAMRNRRSRLAQRMIWKEKSPQTTTLEGEMRGKLRTAVPDALMLTTFERDHFTCRYSHCKKRTIYIPVLQALSALFPDIIPYHSNWTPLEEHIIYWTYCTSLEHRISFPHGGTSNPENLITACYLCNDIKNMIRATDLGWEVGKIQAEDWDGLKSYLPALMEAVARRAPEGTSGTKAGGLATSRRTIVENGKDPVLRLRLGSLVRAVLPGKKTRRNYRVDRLDGSQVVLYEMWRRDSDRVWIKSDSGHIVELSELKGVVEVLRTAPVPGSAD